MLTEEQQNILTFAKSGHNFLLTGRAGTGKSFVVKEIISALRGNQKRVVVICSSGVACTVYEPGVASTVHSFYALQTADLPWKKLLQRSSSSVLVKERVTAADTIIWDEASMSSGRILELVNCLHHELATDDVRQNTPFASTQMILVGDFLQLRPVPSDFDIGVFMFQSPLFLQAIPHRFDLTRIMRQRADELQFLKLLSDLRLGECCIESEDYIRTLSRNLDQEIADSAVHIFFMKIPAQLHNMDSIRVLPGNALRFDATCEGDTRKPNCPAEKVLLLKPGCKVMLVWNLSEELKNGTQGVFIGQEGDKLKVQFRRVGSILLKKETWVKRDRNGQVVGTIRQFPLVLAYAMTCHKSQGLTLNSVILHCSREFVPGLMYVACSRVESASHLQVVNFKRNYLLPPPAETLSQCRNDCGESFPDLSCCCNKRLEGPYFQVTDSRSSHEGFDAEEDLQFPSELHDGVVTNCFERPDLPFAEDLLSVYDRLHRSENQCSRPPETLVVNEMLNPLKVLQPKHENEAAKNAILNDMISGRFGNNIQAFVSLIWYHFFLIFEASLVDGDPDEVLVISRQSFTAATGDLHTFICTDEYVQYVMSLFGTSVLTLEQRSVAFQLTLKVYTKFLEHLCETFKRQCEEDPVPFLVNEMPAVGRAKIRHVGGWVIRKLLESSRKYVRDNLYTLNSDTANSVRKHSALCAVLEDNAVIPFAQLESSSCYKETLEVTESRQYRERGLLHISDSLYEFFLLMEQARVDSINEQRMKMVKEDLVVQAQEAMQNSEQLKDKWRNCFPDINAKEELVDYLFVNAIEAYTKMGASQFLRDFRRAHTLKKTAELRKRVLQKQKKSAERQDSIPFKEILQDRSPSKVEAHARLSNFARKHRWEGFVRVYTKPQLQVLCEAYELQVRSSYNKTRLAKELANAISQKVAVPISCCVDDRQYSVGEVSTDREGRIRMRLTTQRQTPG